MALYSQSCTEEWSRTVQIEFIHSVGGLINIPLHHQRQLQAVPDCSSRFSVWVSNEAEDDRNWLGSLIPPTASLSRHQPLRCASGSECSVSDSLSRIYLPASPVYILHMTSFNKSLSFHPLFNLSPILVYVLFGGALIPLTFPCYVTDFMASHHHHHWYRSLLFICGVKVLPLLLPLYVPNPPRLVPLFCRFCSHQLLLPLPLLLDGAAPNL